MTKRGRVPLILGVVLLWTATTSLAAEISGKVAPLSPSVSLAVDGSSPVATYKVTVANESTVKPLSNARFVARATVCSAVSADGSCTASIPLAVESAKYGNGTNLDCPLSTGDSKTFDCYIGTLATKNSTGDSKTFFLTFKSPKAGVRIDLDWHAVFDNGTPPGGSNGDNEITSIALSAPSTGEVTSAVPGQSPALTVFTGYFAIPDNDDPVTTEINVPALLAISSTAAVKETPSPEDDRDCKSQRNFNRCYRTEISIPDVKFTELDAQGGKFFAFKLRVNKSNIRNGAKIDKVVIRYSADGVVVTSPGLQFCAKHPTSGDPVPNTAPDSIYVPCIAYANDYSKKGAGTWFGFEWIIYNLSNGFFDLL